VFEAENAGAGAGNLGAVLDLKEVGIACWVCVRFEWKRWVPSQLAAGYVRLDGMRRAAAEMGVRLLRVGRIWHYCI
jgi:hypothetical protein